MRTTLLGLIFCILFYSTIAQQKLPSLDYTPQSPTTAAFTRYGDVPVDLSTGVPSVEIPVYTLSVHGINVPISISYHASGIKVQDVASVVGLGWVLNAGGVITRSVFGQPDEGVEMGGTARPPFKTTDQFLQLYNSYTDPGFAAYEILYFYFNKQLLDYYSDRFYYNLGNGESGIFRKDFQNDTVRLIPYKPIKTQFYWKDGGHDGNHWMISMTTSDGTVYHFARNQSNDIWHIDRIVNSSGTDSVQFYSHYESISVAYINDVANFGIYRSSTLPRNIAVIQDNNSPPCSKSMVMQYLPDGPERSGSSFTSSTDEFLIVDSIVASNGVVRFSYVKDRIDGFVGYAPKSRLTKIQVFNKPAGALVKEINLSHSYGAAPVANYTKRLFLDSLAIGANQEEKYKFKYNPLYLPVYPMGGGPAFSEDFWGYYNGSTSTTLLSTQFVDGAGGAGAGDRFPRENFAKASILEEIQYPTGGKTVFEFEGNRTVNNFYGFGFNQSEIPDNKLVGGLRVKKITTYPYEGATPQVKQYEYACNVEDLYGYISLSNFAYNQQVYNVYEMSREEEYCPFIYAFLTQYNRAVDKAMGRMIGTARVPLVYDQVTEYIGDGNTNTGKTMYYYEMPDRRDDNNDDPRFQGPYPYDYGNYTPHLIKKEEYKNDNGQYKIVRKTETPYDAVVHRKTFITGFNLECGLEFNNLAGGSVPDGARSFVNDYGGNFFANLFYGENKGYTDLRLPDRTVVYDYADETHYLKTTTQYQYNEYGQQVAATTTTSKGDVLTSSYKYPVDFASQVPYSTMVAKNMIAPVIEASTVKNATTTSPLQTIRTNYNYWNYPTYSWGDVTSNLIVPQSVVTTKGSNTSDTRLQYYSYDKYGNAISAAKTNDYRQTYIWAYNNTYPVARVVNASEDQVAYTSFEDETLGYWLLNGTKVLVADNTAPTGKACLSLNGVGISKNALSSSLSYIISYWYKSGSIVTVSPALSDVYTSAVKNGWVLVKGKVTGTTTVSISGNGYIDEVRLYPALAQMTTFAYEPLVGMTAQSDANDRITYYEYDASGRLSIVRDDDRNVLKKICYNYQGQPDACGVNATPLWQATGVTRCKPCPQNTNYTINVQQQQEKDNNINSTSYGDTRWVDMNVAGNCYITPDWQYTTNYRCVTVDGQITGEQQREQTDVNPCSNYGQTRWVSVGTNTTACKPPTVFNSQDVSGTYYSQNCGSTQLPTPFTVSMPAGSYTSSTSVDAATALARQAAQQQANTSGGCKTIYVKLIKVDQVIDSSENYVERTADFHIKFYADAAGTIATTLPSDVVINWKKHFYNTSNGGAPYGDGYEDNTIRGYAGMEEVSLLDFEIKNCSWGACINYEPILTAGRYVIIQ